MAGATCDGATCLPTDEDNTGVQDIAPVVIVPTSDQAVRLGFKDAQLQGQQAATADYLGPGQVTPASNPKCPDGCAPYSFELKNTPLHYEGEGNGNKRWTCGPAATRNMVQAMTGYDYGELRFEGWENTAATQSTSMASIVNALNKYFGSYDAWDARIPSSPADLLALVATDTYNDRHGVISNVSTQYLMFWNGHATRHFNLMYGYNHAKNGLISIAEEWNPAAIGVRSTYGNPYGYHAEPVLNAFTAVHRSPTQQIAF